MAFLKQHLRKKWVLGGLGLLFCLLAALSVYLYQRHQALEQAQKEKAYYAQFETVDPLKDAKPVTFGDQNQFVAAPFQASVTQNYVVSSKYTRLKDKHYNTPPHSKKGYVYKVVVLDINHGFKRQEFDLYQAVEDYDDSYGLGGFRDALSYKGKDYAIISLVKTAAKKKTYTYVAMDLSTGKLSALPEGLTLDYNAYDYYYDYYNDVIKGTTLYSQLTDYNLHAFRDYIYNYSSGDSDSKSSEEAAISAAQSLNLFSDNIELKGLVYHQLEGEDYAIFPRPDSVSAEEWFNTALHWFAPAGGEDLTVYGLDSSGQPTSTAIRSYADYQAWKASNSG